MHRVAASAASLLLAVPCAAQVRASEAAAVSQTIDGTVITIEYSRPMAKGRTLFGERRAAVVHWGEVWTPGANWATTLEASRDIHLGGQRLPKGKYSVWLVPRDTGDWTLFLDREARRFHTRRARPDDAVLRLAVRPDAGPHLEGLTWYFPSVTPDGATLRLHWGTTVVAVPVRVEPTRPAPVAAGERAGYVGTYRYRFDLPNRPDTVRRTIEIMETADGIRGRSTPAFFPGYDEEFDLIPLGERRFRVGLRRDGKFLDAEEMVMRFTVVSSRATGFEIPTPEGDRIGIRGERVQ